MKSPKNLFLLLIFVLSTNIIYSANLPNNIIPSQSQAYTLQQVEFLSPGIRSWVFNTGIFNQDMRTTNTPGFEWPINSGKFAVFTTGLSIAAMINGQLKQAMASYKGEYAPGYIINSGGIPTPMTNNNFKVYKIKAGDNYGNNPDWANWGLMVPYGAPYWDANHNNTYDPQIDTPGIKGAYQTLFVCLTDGFPESHNLGEGFGGGTDPIFAEVHLTAWSFSNQGFEDVQYVKWEIFNKNTVPWNSTQITLFSDPDLGNADDDYIGCDTSLGLGFCYNGDDNDEQGSNTYNYGLHPPAVGFLMLEGSVNKSVTPNKNLKISSFVYSNNTSTGGAPCENDPNGEILPAYYFMKGIKKDQTPWVLPPGGESNVTKYCYNGDPESGSGWNESVPGVYHGSVLNCGGPTVYTGQTLFSNYKGDRRIIMSSGADNFTVAPGEKQTFMIAQLIARGNNNLHSVTLLKAKALQLKNLHLLDVEKKGVNVPVDYYLYQNYPNPFNPSTKIKFDVPQEVRSQKQEIRLIIYDILGKEIKTLVNELLSSGTYEVEWDASNYPSGIYFYTLTTNNFTQTKRMVLVK